MNLPTRRKFLNALAGGVAAGLGGLLWRREPAFAAAAEQQATALPDHSVGRQFTNRLRLPGASGLYAAVAAKDVKQITVSELDFDVLPRVWSAFWAYVAEVDNKRLLNPTLLARPGDQIKLRMVNRLKQPTIIHWHGLTNDERNDGIGMRETFIGAAQRLDVLLDLREASWREPVFLKSLAFDPMHNESIDDKTANCLPAPCRAAEQTPTPLMRAAGSRMAWKCRCFGSTSSHPPMHVHGFQFRVLERRGSPAQVKELAIRNSGLLPQDMGLLDTVLVWPGESVRIALDFSHPFKGDQIYMFHCHNLKHEDTGMMIGYRVRA